MAQSGYTPIKLYYSTVTGNAPTATNLSDGELAINIADGKLFYKDSGGTVSVLAQAGAVVANAIAGGTANQVVYQTGPNTTSFIAAPSTPGTFLYWSGSSFSWLTGAGLGSVTSVDADGGTTGLTFTGGPITTAGTLTMSGTLAVSHGGTGITSFGTGVATALGYNTTGSGGMVLEDSPLLVTPNLGIPSAVDLTNATNVPADELVGTVDVTNGGTGAATLTANSLIVGNGTSPVAGIAPGASGYVLASNGTNWVAVSPEAAGGSPIGTMVYMAGTTTTGYPGTTWLKCDGSIISKSTYSTLFDRIGYAPDGFSTQTQWGYMGQATTSTIWRMTYGGGRWIYVNNGGRIGTSTDGFKWSAETTVTTSILYDVSYGGTNNLYTVVGNVGVLYTSTNAASWSVGTSNTTSILYVTHATPSLISIAGDFGAYQASTDGVIYSTYGINMQYTTANATPRVARNGNTYVAAGGLGFISYANAALSFTQWSAATSGTVSELRDVISNGSNLFITGGVGGVLLTSLNGATWTARTSGTTSHINCLTNNGTTLYVYAGVGGALSTSPDGTTWTARTSGTASEIRDIHWDGSQYVYVGVGGVVATSPNAITWTARTSTVTFQLEGVWGNGTRWVAAGFEGTVVTSTDAITWSTTTTPTFSREDFSSVAFGNSTWVLVTQSGQSFTSTDGITWGWGKNFNLEFLNVNFLSGVFVFSASNFVATSTDLISYVYAGGSAMNRRIYDITTNTANDKWVMVSTSKQNNSTAQNRWSNIRYSSDGYTWLGAPVQGDGPYTQNCLATTVTYLSVGYGDGMYVAGGNNGQVLTSTDGETWTSYGLATNSTATMLEFGTDLYVLGYEMQRNSTQTTWWNWTTAPNPSTANQGLFAPVRAINDGTKIVTCGGSGLAWTTTDWSAWTQVTATTSGQQLNCLSYNGSVYVIGGQAATILSSTDAVTWTPRTSAGGTHHYGLAWGSGPGLWVMTSNTGAIQTSPDGITWTARTSGTAQSLNWAHYANNLYVAVGNNNTVVTSTNGTTWTLTSVAGGNWGYVTYAQSKWVLSGTANVLTTTDFVTFSTVYTSPQSALSVRAYYGDISGKWYLVHDFGNIVTSTDLVTFSKRYGGVPQNVAINGMTYDGTYWVAGTSTNVSTAAGRNLFTSTDAQTWVATGSQQETISVCNYVEYGNGITLAVGNAGRGFYAATDPSVSFYSWALLTTSTPRSIAYGSDGKVVVVGQGGFIRYSTDGRVFNTVTSGTTSVLNTVSYGNGLWVCAGDGGALRTSTDGITWTGTTLGGAPSVLDIIYVPEQSLWLYTTAGAPGGVVTTTDFVTFTGRATTIATGNIYTAVWGNGQLIVGSDTGEMSISNNAVNGYWAVWRAITSPTVSTQGILRLNYFADDPKINYIFGSSNGVIATSSGGWEWDMHRCMSVGTTTAQFGAVWSSAYHDGYYFIGGQFGSTFYTRDPNKWTTRIIPTITSYDIYEFASTPYGLLSIGLSSGIYHIYSPTYNYNTAIEFRVPDAIPEYLPSVNGEVDSALWIKAL